MIEYQTTLSSIPVGACGRIVAISPKPHNAKRLRELGFSVDANVRMLHTSPFGGTIAYLIKGSVMALRQEDADKIYISIKEE